eukprot:365338-Chlamydomonas_euryale.AAC.19
MPTHVGSAPCNSDSLSPTAAACIMLPRPIMARNWCCKDAAVSGQCSDSTIASAPLASAPPEAPLQGAAEVGPIQGSNPYTALHRLLKRRAPRARPVAPPPPPPLGAPAAVAPRETAPHISTCGRCREAGPAGIPCPEMCTHTRSCCLKVPCEGSAWPALAKNRRTAHDAQKLLIHRYLKTGECRSWAGGRKLPHSTRGPIGVSRPVVDAHRAHDNG